VFLEPCLYHAMPIQPVSRKKRAHSCPKFTGISEDSAERVTLVYEGGTRNVKKKQRVHETRVPVLGDGEFWPDGRHGAIKG
jgi:hypothetical protein